jgi:hypothetical protein
MDATTVGNQIESKPKTDGGPSCSKKRRSNDRSSSDSGDYQKPLGNNIERNEDLKVEDEGDWDFWISCNQMTF